MTRRILLVLDESVTATECGGCHMLSSVRSEDATYVEWVCDAFPNAQDMDMTSAPAKRVTGCIEAEKAAERCVEIEPSSAGGLVDRWPFDGVAGWMDKMRDALEEHAAKAGGAK